MQELSRNLSKPLGRNSLDILLVIPGLGKQVLGFLMKENSKPGECKPRIMKHWVLEGIADRIVRIKHQGKSGFDDFDRS